MATYTTGLTNGVSWGYKHIVTAADAAANEITFDFQTDRAMAWSVGILRSNAVIALTGAVITIPAAGQLKIADGGSFALTEGDVISIVGQADSSVYTY